MSAINPDSAVVDEHEQEHDQGRDADGDHPLPDRVRPQRRTHRALLQDLDGRGQRARPQDDGQIARLLDGELPGDDRPAGRDPLIDARGRVHVAVQDDGQLLADVALGDLAEAPGPLRIELDGDLPIARRIGVGRDFGARELGPRQQRPLLDDDGYLLLGLSVLVHPALGEEFGALRQAPGDGLVDWGLIVDELEFEEGRLADESLGARGVLQPGKLYEDPIVALAGDDRLRHAELIDAVADRLHGLADEVVAQPGYLARAHGEDEAAGRLVLAPALEAGKLSDHGEDVVPALR